MTNEQKVDYEIIKLEGQTLVKVKFVVDKLDKDKKNVIAHSEGYEIMGMPLVKQQIMTHTQQKETLLKGQIKRVVLNNQEIRIKEAQLKIRKAQEYDERRKKFPTVEVFQDYLKGQQDSVNKVQEFLDLYIKMEKDLQTHLDVEKKAKEEPKVEEKPKEEPKEEK